MPHITIHQAVLADLDALASLFDDYRQFYGQPSDLAAARAFLQARFEHGESTIFCAKTDGQAVGFTQLYPSFSSVSMAGRPSATLWCPAGLIITPLAAASIG